MTRAHVLSALAGAFVLGAGLAAWSLQTNPPAAAAPPPLPQGDLYVIGKPDGACMCIFDGAGGAVKGWACTPGEKPDVAVCRIGIGGPL